MGVCMYCPSRQQADYLQLNNWSRGHFVCARAERSSVMHIYYAVLTKAYLTVAHLKYKTRKSRPLSFVQIPPETI